MSKTDFRDKKLPDEQGTIVTADMMARLNNQVPTGEDFDGSAPLLYGEAYGTANDYNLDFVFGKKEAEGTNTSVSTGKLVDTGATFVTNGVQVGDTVLNVSDRTSARVVSVDDENTLTMEADIFTATGKKYAVGPHVFQAPLAITEGMAIAFRVWVPNTGPSTLTVNGLTPLPIKKQNGVALVANDMDMGQVVKVVYVSGWFQLVSTPNNVYNADMVDGKHAGGANGLATLDANSRVVEAAGKVTDQGGGSNLKVKVIDIGDWNMDTTANVNVAHGLTLGNIRTVEVTIRSDTGGVDYPFPSFDSSGNLAGWIPTYTTTNVSLFRTTGGTFDGTGFDSTSYNRGWITIWYTE